MRNSTVPALVYPAAAMAFLRAVGDFGALPVVDRGRRRLFEQLLMAALDGALALAQDLDVAVLVGQDLEFDVPRRGDELLQVDVGRAERGAGLLLRLRKQRRQILGPVDHAHAAPAAARGGLEDDGIADPGGHLQRLFGALEDARRAGQHRHAHLPHERAGALLHPHQPDDLGPRPDELDAGGFANLGEAGVLAQEAVARMDGVHVGDFRGADDGGDVQVAAGALGRADADGLVGETHVRAVTVGFRIDGDRLDSQFLAGADDANGNLAPIGDENLAKPHGWQTGPPRTPPAARS